MELEMKLTFALTAVNVILLLALSYIYGRNWVRLKTSFSAGLLLFTLAFLVQYVMSFYFYVVNMHFYVDMVSRHVFALTVLQTIAFSILNGISWR